MSDFMKPLPEWNNPGIEPPQNKKDAGWQPNEKPPADYLNWMHHTTKEAIQETRDKIGDLLSLSTTEKGSLVGSVNEIDAQLVEKAQDIDILQSVEVNVRKYKTDINTWDDAISDAISECVTIKSDGSKPILLFPYSNGYPTTNTITIPSEIAVEMDSPIIYQGTDNICALIVGEASVQTNVSLKLNVKRLNQSDWLDEGCIGIKVINATTSDINIVESSGFTIGVQFLASSTSVAYNHIKLGRLLNNKIGVDCTNESNGWNNENNFYGGQILCYSSTNNGKSRYGIRITSKDGLYPNNNNNNFYKPSIELKQTSASPGEALPILIEYGEQNSFQNVRNESNGTYVLRTMNSSKMNEVSVGYGTSLIDSQGATIGAVGVQRASVGLDRTSSAIFDSGHLRKRANHYDGSGGIYIPETHLRHNSNTTKYVSRYFTLGEEYIECSSSTGAIAVYVDTSSVKKFTIKKSVVSGYGGRIHVIGYDINGTILGELDNGSAWVKTFGNLVWATEYGGGYKNGSDSESDLTIELNDTVKKIEIILANGSAVLRLKKFQICTPFTTSNSASNVWNEYTDKNPENVGLATAIPTVGTYSKGRYLKNDNATEQGTAGSKYIIHGWFCITSGTPGTWVNCRSLTGN